MTERIRPDQIPDRRSHKSEIEHARTVALVFGAAFNLTHQSGRKRGTGGMPDVYIQAPMFSFWYECKVGKDELSDLQQAFIDGEIRVGRPVAVGDAHDLRAMLTAPLDARHELATRQRAFWSAATVRERYRRSA